ncbi:MAG: GAF domain-containing protein [Anaerolineae bacterium]|nr:GAF domain-containing protein [Anaerolineae bacterium]
MVTGEEHKRDLALFRTLVAALSGSQELEQLLHQTLRTIIGVLDTGCPGVVLLVNPRHPGLEVVAHHGLTTEAVPRRVFFDHQPCQQVLSSGLPLLDRNCPGCELCPASEHSEADWHLVVPLKNRQQVLGVLCLACPARCQPESWDLSLWEDIGLQIGRAIYDARLQVQIQQERELLQTLYTISDHLATSLDLDWVLSQVLDLSISATDAADGSIVLLTTHGGPSSRVLSRGLDPSQEEQIINEVLSHGLAGWVVRHGEGTIVPNTAADPRWLPLPDDPSPRRSALCVPLATEERVLGVLTLNHDETGHFDRRLLALMTAIAHQAATAIEKARLHNEVAHLAEVLARRVEERTRELRDAQDQLIQAEKLAALGELAAGIAHEINNPLQVLRAYVEYVTSILPTDTSDLEVLEPMQKALDNIGRLAGQLRDFSRPASGLWQPLNVNAAVESVLRLARKELSHRGIEIETSLATYLPEVNGDSRQLEQVFLNLVLNARDAMPGGGLLRLRSWSDADLVYVQFTDTGAGIREEDLQRIFEPYFTTKDDRGTGLGLAICRRVAAQHGGDVRVSSKWGEGARFTVELPVARKRPQGTGARRLAGQPLPEGQGSS